MDEYFSPEEIRSFMSRCETDRQRLILFLIYNYGLSLEDILDIKAGQLMFKPDYILFNYSKKATGKQRTVKIQSENYRLFYRVGNKLQAHEALLHKDKNVPISESMVKKDLFDLAVIMNRKITLSQLFDSHLYWIFRKGVNFSQAVEEYGISLSGKPFKIWQDALTAGRHWPLLLE
jgi:hypothetical protein